MEWVQGKRAVEGKQWTFTLHDSRQSTSSPEICEHAQHACRNFYVKKLCSEFRQQHFAGWCSSGGNVVMVNRPLILWLDRSSCGLLDRFMHRQELKILNKTPAHVSWWMPQHAQLNVAVPRQENALSKGRRNPEVSAGISWNSLVCVEIMVVKQSRRYAKYNVTGCRSEDTSRRPICNHTFPWNSIETGNVKISRACNTNRNRSDHTEFADTAHSEE